MKSVIIVLALFVCWCSCAPAADVTTLAPTGTTKEPFIKLSCKGHNPNGFFVDPTDPTKFHQCSHGVHVATFHCQAGTIFSEAEQVCIIKHVDEAQCPDKNFNGSIPLPGNPHKFIECSMGHGYIRTCSGDLIFKPETSRCDYNDEGKTWPTDTVPTQPPTTPVSTVAGSTPVKVTGSTPAPVSTVAPACEGKGNSPDPNDKTKYFNCHLGKLIHLTCPDGEVYNKDTKECE